MGKKSTKFGIAMIAGAALGYAASLFVSDKTKHDHKAKLVDTFDTATDKVLSKKDQKRLKEVFDSTAKKHGKQFDEIRSALTENIKAANKTLGVVNKKKYITAVEKTIADLKDKGELNKKQLTKIQGFLEADYDVFKESKKELDDAA